MEESELTKKYTTQSGDMFDLIAFRELGDCKYTEKLIDANRDKIDNFIFSAGEVLNIPDVSKDKVDTLPPWRK